LGCNQHADAACLHRMSSVVKQFLVWVPLCFRELAHYIVHYYQQILTPPLLAFTDMFFNPFDVNN